MNKYLSTIFLILFILSCTNDNTKILPKSSGKTHNILLIMDDNDWKNELGDTVRKYFAEEFSDLPQSEPLFSLQQAAPELFSGIFKTVRNILIIKKGSNPGVRFYTNKYAEPQLIVYIEEKDNEKIKKLIDDYAVQIIKRFRESEIRNLQNKHRKSLRNNKDIEQALNIKIDIPNYFTLVDHQKNFFWLRRDLKTGEQDILLYTIPLKKSKDIEPEKVIYYRDSIGKKYIPGPTDDTYMKSEKNISPSQEFIEIDEKKALESRGLWNMKNDFMGGPYINYTILDKENNRLIVAEGFIYAPAIDKRDYMVQLEAILKTLKVKN